MSNDKKTFVEFIVDASEESELPEGQQKKLIRGFYEIVGQDVYDDEVLKDYLEGQGYTVTEKDKLKIRNLQNTVKCLWEDLHNTDY